MSTKYIHFTEEQREQARQTDLVSFLRSQGGLKKFFYALTTMHPDRRHIESAKNFWK